MLLIAVLLSKFSINPLGFKRIAGVLFTRYAIEVSIYVTLRAVGGALG